MIPCLHNLETLQDRAIFYLQKYLENHDESFYILYMKANQRTVEELNDIWYHHRSHINEAVRLDCEYRKITFPLLDHIHRDPPSLADLIS